MKKIALIFALGVVAAAANAQSLIYYNNFNNFDGTDPATLLTPSINLVSGSFSTPYVPANPFDSTPGAGEWGNPTGSLTNARNGDVAGQSISFAGQPAAAAGTLTMSLTTTGYSAIVLNQWVQRSGTGHTTIALDYSLDSGSTWNVIGTATANATPGNLVTINLPSAIDNQANVQLRWTFTGNTSATGTIRTDNLTLEAVPEPGTMLALGAGLAALAARRRRKSA